MATKGIFMVCILASICRMVAADTIQLTHYTHETRGGPNNTFLQVAGVIEPNIAIGANFGSFVVFDNEMRDGPNETSNLIGRISGLAVGVVMPSTTNNQGTRVQIRMQQVFGEKHPHYGSYITLNGIFSSEGSEWELVAQGSGGLRGYNGYGIVSQLSTTTGPGPIINIYKRDVYLSKPF